ncbi:hypothetical protein OB13_19945, partial [Pontibacter sp. HJ8]
MLHPLAANILSTLYLAVRPTQLKTVLAVLLLLWASATCLAQKVALVLSGGGAKGIAHVGVLKALEENNIP